jgi:hypothetical protein
LTVTYGSALPSLQNETCSGAQELVPGENVELTLADSLRDLRTECAAPLGEAVFRFVLTESQDVLISAASLDDRGEPTISLLDERCNHDRSELTCRTGSPAVLFARALPPGTYHAAIGATGPADVDVRLDLFAPTEAPDGEGCDRALGLEPGEIREVALSRRADAIASACLPGGVDATYSLTLAERSDVLLVGRASNADTVAVSLTDVTCEPKSALVCEASPSSPVRARAYAVEPGEYRAVAESQLGSPVTMSALVRPATATTLVSLSDSCEDAVRVDEAGGRYTGNTRSAHPDFEAGCDFGGAPEGGSADQMLQLQLSEPRRVVLDMQGSRYSTLLVVREGSSCPGRQVENACAVANGPARSFLDLALDRGDYWIQIDGFDDGFEEDDGAWVLDVFTAPL